MLINEVGQNSPLDHCLSTGLICDAPRIMVGFVRLKIQRKGLQSLHKL
jgi:hypothetical protein